EISGSFLSNWVPSIKSQKESKKLYEKASFQMEKFLQKIGVLKCKKQTKENPYITFETFKHDFPEHDILKQLYIIDNKYYSVVPLFSKETNISFFKTLQNEKRVYVNKVAFINQDIAYFSQALAVGLISFLALFFLFLVKKF